jgi:diadenosine tetraphosphate (Ap4A) HIT family hydrolase
VPESPEQFWERARGALRVPPVEEWDTWPFRGPVAPRDLERPAGDEPVRHGAGGIDCRRCREGDADALWSDEHWIVRALPPNGLPIVVLLETRGHHDFPDLPDDLAADLGPMMLRVHRAVLAAGDIGRVHVCRFGEGSEHFHMWFIARPARMHQLASSFAMIWDDILPPVPQDVWQANCDRVRTALEG